MRWFWIDQFLEFESGTRAVALKNVCLTEEQIDDYLPGFPVMPAPLIIEGLAQTGGLLVAEHGEFRERVVLAKVAKAVFHFPALAGRTLIYTAVVEDISHDGAICYCTSHIDDKLQAEIELVFAYLDDRFEGVDLFDPANFCRMLRMLRLFDFGKAADGTRLQPPQHLLDAERAADATLPPDLAP